MEEKDCSPSYRERELGLDRRETGLFYPTVVTGTRGRPSPTPPGPRMGSWPQLTRFPVPRAGVHGPFAMAGHSAPLWGALANRRGPTAWSRSSLQKGSPWRHELVREEHSCQTQGMYRGGEPSCGEATSAGYGLDASKAETRTIEPFCGGSGGLAGDSHCAPPFSWGPPLSRQAVR